MLRVSRGPQAGPAGPNEIGGMSICGDQSLGGFGAGSVVEPESKADTGVKTRADVARQTGTPTGLSFRSNDSGAYRGFRVRFISFDVLQVREISISTNGFVRPNIATPLER